MSCQYPLAGVKDLSELNMNNVENNTWKYIKTDETDCTDCASLRDPVTGELKVDFFEIHEGTLQLKKLPSY